MTTPIVLAVIIPLAVSVAVSFAIAAWMGSAARARARLDEMAIVEATREPARPQAVSTEIDSWDIDTWNPR